MGTIYRPHMYSLAKTALQHVLAQFCIKKLYCCSVYCICTVTQWRASLLGFFNFIFIHSEAFIFYYISLENEISPMVGCNQLKIDFVLSTQSFHSVGQFC